MPMSIEIGMKRKEATIEGNGVIDASSVPHRDTGVQDRIGSVTFLRSDLPRAIERARGLGKSVLPYEHDAQARPGRTGGGLLGSRSPRVRFGLVQLPLLDRAGHEIQKAVHVAR